jgi:hypothetical protein
MEDENYFDPTEEGALRDAWCMIHSDETDYNTLREVILGETILKEQSLDYWKENIDEHTTDE